MKTTIITVSYDQDLEYLKYCLKSIKKFCKGYYGNVVVIDDHENDCTKTKEYLESIEQKYIIDTEAKNIRKGYIRQQYIKLKADLYVPEETSHILHIDSDSIFTKEHTPDVFFENNKPIILKESYEQLLKQLQRQNKPLRGVERWQSVTSTFTKRHITHEYMRLMPLVYPTTAHKKTRMMLEFIQGKTLLDILKDEEFASEYNMLGAICDDYYQDEFRFIDKTNELEKYRDYIQQVNKVARQFSARPNQDRYVDIHSPNNEIVKLLG
jgi:hypothetical protein